MSVKPILFPPRLQRVMRRFFQATSHEARAALLGELNAEELAEAIGIHILVAETMILELRAAGKGQLVSDLLGTVRS